VAENRCNQCGATNAPEAKFCGSCGATLAGAWNQPQPPPPTNYIGPQPGAPPPEPSTGTSNKAIISLVLGILSIVCCGPFSGIPGAIVGKMEMDAIKQGRSPESNMGMAKAGFWISIIGSILYIVGFVLAILFGFLSSLTNLY
jgi:Domain of unknown function (DUF4190)/zinc-ribbon domain